MSESIKHILKVTNEIRQGCRGVARRAGGDCDYIDEIIKYTVNEDNGILFVKVHEESIVGFIIGYDSRPPEYTQFLPGEKTSKIDWLCVDKKYWHCGIGAGLMRAYIDHARSKGFKGLFLKVEKEAPRLVKYYKRFGFEIIGWNALMGKIL